MRLPYILLSILLNFVMESHVTMSILTTTCKLLLKQPFLELTSPWSFPKSCQLILIRRVTIVFHKLYIMCELRNCYHPALRAGMVELSNTHHDGDSPTQRHTIQ